MAQFGRVHIGWPIWIEPRAVEPPVFIKELTLDSKGLRMVSIDENKIVLGMLLKVFEGIETANFMSFKSWDKKGNFYDFTIRRIGPDTITPEDKARVLEAGLIEAAKALGFEDANDYLESVGMKRVCLIKPEPHEPEGCP